METYFRCNCRICTEEWETEEYYGGVDYICPLCDMSVIEMIKEVYPIEGIKEVLKMIWYRIINFRKYKI